jgi:hypothetical protein
MDDYLVLNNKIHTTCNCGRHWTFIFVDNASKQKIIESIKSGLKCKSCEFMERHKRHKGDKI